MLYSNFSPGADFARQQSHKFRELTLGIITLVADLIFIVRYSRRVRQQVAQRDRSPTCLRAGQVARYAVIKPQLSMLFEEQDCGRGELLADRSRLEDAVPRDGRLGIEIGKAVALCHHDVPVFDGSEGHSGNCLPGHLRRDKLVYLRYGI